MRIELKFNHLLHQVLPINYQYLISSWIYRTLEKSDAQFSEWLHKKGYSDNDKNYKLFTFSPLYPQQYRIDKQNKTFTLQKGPTWLVVSFLVEEGYHNFIKGIFKNQLVQLSSGQHFKTLMSTIQANILQPPIFNKKMQFRFTTAVCIAENVIGRKYEKYLHPIKDTNYAYLYKQNLINKASIFYGNTYSHSDIELKIITPSEKNKKPITAYQRNSS